MKQAYIQIGKNIGYAIVIIFGFLLFHYMIEFALDLIGMWVSFYIKK